MTRAEVFSARPALQSFVVVSAVWARVLAPAFEASRSFARSAHHISTYTDTRWPCIGRVNRPFVRN